VGNAHLSRHPLAVPAPQKSLCFMGCHANQLPASFIGMQPLYRSLEPMSSPWFTLVATSRLVYDTMLLGKRYAKVQEVEQDGC
jgi:hypothetical protein